MHKHLRTHTHPGQERLGPSYFFIPLVLGPLNSLVWYVPSLSSLSLGWRIHCGANVTESSTNKQHHLSMRVRVFAEVYYLKSVCCLLVLNR